MKLIVRDYLASLKERDELEVICGNLLSQMKLEVKSRPKRGSRQDGVDILACGVLPIETEEKVYLITIKSGNLTRANWDSGENAVRPSIQEIFDAYLPSKLEKKYDVRKKVICICLGGDVDEAVQNNLSNSITDWQKQYSKHQIKIEVWNGDKLAGFIVDYFLNQDLLFETNKVNLRKSLALLAEPAKAMTYFTKLVHSIENIEKNCNKKSLCLALQQLNLCLAILYSWCCEEKNLEASYLASELVVLHGWHVCKLKYKSSKKISESYKAILGTYKLISESYFNKIIPYLSYPYELSEKVGAVTHHHVGVNLKLFDILGRFSVQALILWHKINKLNEVDLQAQLEELKVHIINLIKNNPILDYPYLDEQIIDITLAILFLGKYIENTQFVKDWIRRLTSSAISAYRNFSYYPRITCHYEELLDHPKYSHHKKYQQEITKASILYPTLALLAAIFDEKETCVMLQNAQSTFFSHSTFQLIYVSKSFEDQFFQNGKEHGICLVDINVKTLVENYKKYFLLDEKHKLFAEISCNKNNLDYLILIGCRHYRHPIPLELFEELLMDR